MAIKQSYLVGHRIFSSKSSFSLVLVSVWILWCCDRSVKGRLVMLQLGMNQPVFVIIVGILTLSPMTVAPVCRVGDQLNLTCTTTTESVEFLQWSIPLVNEHGTMLEEITRYINSGGAYQTSQTLLNSTTFTFTRSSIQGILPLISMLLVDSVSTGLNGTVVHCMEVLEGNSLMTPDSASTTIQIINVSNSESAVIPCSP